MLSKVNVNRIANRIEDSYLPLPLTTITMRSESHIAPYGGASHPLKYIFNNPFDMKYDIHRSSIGNNVLHSLEKTQSAV